MTSSVQKSAFRRFAAGLIVLVAFTAFHPAAWAQVAPSLGAAESFAVLGGSTVTNTGPSTIYGGLGVSPGTAITGFPPGLVIAPGAKHKGDAVAGNAQSAVTTAYNNLAGQPCQFNLTGQDLGGLTLVAGVYCFSSSAQLTGNLTLDAQGNSGAVFIFQIVSTLTTASNSNVLLINGAQDCNVFWQVGSSATLGTNTTFVGNILALTNIALQTGTSVSGRALARNAAVTLDNNKVQPLACGIPNVPCSQIDTVKPKVSQTISSTGVVSIAIQDTGCGLASITPMDVERATVSIPVFVSGTTSTVIVTAQLEFPDYVNNWFVVQLQITDVAGNVKIYDPAALTLTKTRGGPDTVTVTGILREEHFIDIVNGHPGLDRLSIQVNGQDFWSGRVPDSQSGTLDIARKMKPGSDNTVTFQFGGQAGDKAMILIRPANDD